MSGRRGGRRTSPSARASKRRSVQYRQARDYARRWEFMFPVVTYRKGASRSTCFHGSKEVELVASCEWCGSEDWGCTADESGRPLHLCDECFHNMLDGMRPPRSSPTTSER